MTFSEQKHWFGPKGGNRRKSKINSEPKGIFEETIGQKL